MKPDMYLVMVNLVKLLFIYAYIILLLIPIKFLFWYTFTQPFNINQKSLLILIGCAIIHINFSYIIVRRYSSCLFYFQNFKPFFCTECSFRAPKPCRVNSHINRCHGGLGSCAFDSEMRPRSVSPTPRVEL